MKKSRPIINIMSSAAVFGLVSTGFVGRLSQPMDGATPNARSYYEAGLSDLRAQAYVQAVGDFTLAIDLDPRFADAYLQRALAKRLLGEQMDFVSTERCVDLTQALGLGSVEAASLIMSDCRTECQSLQSRPDLPLEVFCVDYRGQSLTQVPGQVAQYSNLLSLQLGNNQLGELCASALQSPYLLVVDASHNWLTHLPAALCQRTHLRELNLGHNRLTTLPADLGTLTELKALYLRHNQLTQLPASVEGWKNLETLDLAHNALTALPPQLYTLASLRQLTLTGNVIAPAERAALQAALPNCQVIF